MNFKPILFSAPMVRAILEDRKTMTRRIIKKQPEAPRAIYSENDVKGFIHHNVVGGSGIRWAWKNDRYSDPGFILQICPYGHPGDVLWVRETFCHESTDGENWFFVHKAGNENYPMGSNSWKPSIHMPKVACRIFLEITDIRVERLQDITEADAMAEGIMQVTKDGKLMKYCVYDHLNYSCTPWQDMPTNAVAAFDNLWVQINGQESLGANPWVWVVSFKRIERPDNFLTPQQ